MEYFAEGSPTAVIDATRTRALVAQLVERLKPCRRVLLVPPDFSRYDSGAGELAALLYEGLHETATVEVLPALGTHRPMLAEECRAMFPGIPQAAFRFHAWRSDLVKLGEVPADLIHQQSGGRLKYTIACEINRTLVEGKWDHIISLGQLVPHEVAGIANHAKNIFVGVGGADTINKTQFLGAVCGMERAMGRLDTPVRAVLDYMATHLGRHLPIVYVLTVRGRDERGTIVTRGLFAGDDAACFRRGGALCQTVNVALLDEPVQQAVIYLPPKKYSSTWLGNKAIYRMRMAMADGGELLAVGPGIKRFGEDDQIDRLIRTYGYFGTPRTLDLVQRDAELQDNLAVAAHLIHGSSEGRFRISYAAGGLSRAEIEAAGYAWAEPDVALQRLLAANPADGLQTLSGRQIFFVSDPGLGLWASRDRFQE
jgi:nickel-dependent lactate racemase